jgi:DNA processing protein
MDPRLLVDWLALQLLPGLGPAAARVALERYGDPGEIAFRLPPGALAACGRVDLERLSTGRRDLRHRAEREAVLCEQHGVRLVRLGDPAYPAALAEIGSAPMLVYQRGTIDPGVVRIAVVGSRTPTAYGRTVASSLGAGLAARGVEVVSGGARGVDASAHRGALGSDGGRTIAVLGSGLLRTYPPEHAQLFDDISARGALVSEFPMEEPPRAENFPRRNRLISGLSAAVVVVEAAERSGSLSTAAHAIDQSREVLAVPGQVHSLKSVGCHRLIQQGAKLVHEIGDVISELSPMYRARIADVPPASASPRTPVHEDLSADESALLAIVAESGPVHLDHVADAAPFGIARVQAALFGLELRGAVEQTPGKYYVLRPRKEA